MPTPRIMLADETRSLFALNFLVMTKLDGESLIDLEPALDRSEVFPIYEQMGRLLREIHCIAMESFGYVGPQGVLTPVDSNRAYMLSQFEKKLGGLLEYGAPARLAARLREFVERHTPLLDGCTSPSLCHYDFHTGNILGKRRDKAVRLSGILDLENAIAGDPLMDIAKTLNYSVRDDAAKRDGLLAGYGTIDRADWRETVALYELYGVLELWCWWKLIGDDQRATTLLPSLERFAAI